ncbi:MAG: hypothetical protein K2X57_32290 [Xanthobacteraceae bacterium]|nr:hypothetical protein [Xanthobacteraceae bacterium]
MLTTSWIRAAAGPARKHGRNVKRAKAAGQEVIQCCKATPSKPVIEAVAIVFKGVRAMPGIKMKP